MKFADNLYAGKVAGPLKEKIKIDLNNNIFKEGYYILALSEQESDLLEMIQVETFDKPVYRKYNNIDNLRVVGLAVTKKEAQQLMVDIVMDIHKKTGGYDVKKYFRFD